jgi:fluoride exporter
MRMLVAVALGGACGSMARYLVSVLVGRRLGTAFPWDTLAVNLSGAFAMGVLAELALHAWQPSAALRAFLTIGLLGGFTTFSTFSLDAAQLMERGDMAAAAVYMLVSAGGSVAALFGGIQLVRMMAA